MTLNNKDLFFTHVTGEIAHYQNNKIPHWSEIPKPVKDAGKRNLIL